MFHAGSSLSISPNLFCHITINTELFLGCVCFMGTVCATGPSVVVECYLRKIFLCVCVCVSVCVCLEGGYVWKQVQVYLFVCLEGVVCGDSVWLFCCMSVCFYDQEGSYGCTQLSFHVLLMWRVQKNI